MPQEILERNISTPILLIFVAIGFSNLQIV